MEIFMEQIIEKWEEILRTVKEEHELTDISFKTWLEPLKVFDVKDNTLYILVPDEQMGLNYITKKYTLPIKVAVAEIIGKDYEIEFVLPEQAKSMRTPKPMAFVNTESIDKSSLNPNYTFDTFVVGNNNKLAHAASLAVAESPGEVYNPLFLYGGVGLGKTHLMHSIAHFIQSNNPDVKILYVSSETFTNELIEAIRNGNNTAMTKFREKYRNIDVLLIDDIQFIIGKESTQEEFFHTFNELYLAKKQIVISSDKPPKDMETLEERIRSRFECGLTADIGSPDYETRMAILKNKVEMNGYKNISDNILEYIANNVTYNVRELEGALNKISVYAELGNVTITEDLAKNILKDMISKETNVTITPDLIINTVSEHLNISVDDIKSSKRSQDVANARQISMYLCRKFTTKGLKSIGDVFGGKDHSTVLSNINKVDKRIESDPEYAETIDVIIKKLSPHS